MKVHTLILGGGLSGLSCAYHLKRGYLLAERSAEPGGLARSFRHEGFIFDYTGHLLHLRHPYTLKLIPELLEGHLTLLKRRAWIYSHHTFTRYPFQANTYGLPKQVVEECLAGFVEAQLKTEAPSPPPSPESFKSWVLRTFGKGFAKHFFFPYNQKLWTAPPEELTAEWVAPFVPRPSVEEIVLGGLSEQDKKFGYNATFFYPKKGGIQTLANAFARDLKALRLNTEVTAIDLAAKEATLNSGEVVAYERLVATVPLSHFLRMAKPLPPEIETARRSLRWNSVYNLNIGIDRPHLTDKHWIYFPEKKYCFYRVGFPMNFSASMAPRGKSSMYIEVAHAPGHPPDDEDIFRRSLTGLRDSGLLRPDDRVVATKILRMPVAYVIFDKNRTKAVTEILRYLDSRGVDSIGRFGAWKYSYMEEAILEGKAAAERILGS